MFHPGVHRFGEWASFDEWSFTHGAGNVDRCYEKYDREQSGRQPGENEAYDDACNGGYSKDHWHE